METVQTPVETFCGGRHPLRATGLIHGPAPRLDPLWSARFCGRAELDNVSLNITDVNGDGSNELLSTVPTRGTLIFAAGPGSQR